MKPLSVLALLSAAALLARADEVQLSWVPEMASTTVGGTVDLKLNISDVPVCEPGNPANFPVSCTLGAFDATIVYDQTIVGPGPTPFTFGNSLGNMGDYFSSVDTSVAGHISLTQSSFLTGPQLLALQATGSFTLGTLQLTGIAVGHSDVVVESADFTDALGAVMYDHLGPEAGVVTVEPVPEPLSFAPVAVTLGLAMGFSRRKPRHFVKRDS
ncbi:MAG: hypothetical protein ABSE86_02845 [Bryobacteraceae bacterium]|jgi:hypothetical protein